MNLYSELLALAFKGLDAAEFLKRFVSEKPVETGSEVIYRLPAGFSVASDEKKTRAEIDLAKSEGWLIRDHKICFANGRQVAYQTLLDLVKQRTGKRSNEHAIYQILNFDYDRFMSNMRAQLKERLTPQDVLQTVGATQKKGERDMYYLESKPHDGLFHIIPSRNGKNAMWTFKDSKSYPQGYFGNLFDLYCYATGKPSKLHSVRLAYKDIFGEDVGMHILNYIKVQKGIHVNSPVVSKVLQRNISEFKREEVTHPEIVHIPMRESHHRYLRYRGITAETVSSIQFKGVLGSDLAIENGRPEKTGYRLATAIFKPLSFAYKDINGRIINKEFKNYYTKAYLTELRKTEPSAKRSFSRHRGIRSSSVFVSNPPERVTHIVLLESPLDALSYFQFHRNKPGFEWIENALFVANGGTLSVEQVPIIEKLIATHRATTVVPAMDKDMQGRSYNLAMIGLLGEQGSGVMVRHTDTNGTEIEVLGENALERFDLIANQLRTVKLQGGLTTEREKRKLWFFYSEENYEKVADVIAKNRKNHLNILLSTPANAKDWNDELRGLSQPVQKGSRPLLYWLSRRQESNLMRKMDFHEINIQWEAGHYKVKNKDGQVVGVFRLDTLEFTAYQSMEAYLASPVGQPVLSDIAKMRAFLMDGVEGEKIANALDNGLTFKEGKVLRSGSEVARVDGGNLQVLSELDHQHMEALETINVMMRSGLDPNNKLQLSGCNLVFVDNSRSWSLYALAANMDIVPLPDRNEFIKKHPLMEKVLSTWLRKISQVLPSKDIIIPGKGSDFAVYEDTLIWNGKLGRIGEDGRFLLEKSRLTETLPDYVYTQIERFEKMGYEAYQKSINYNKRIRIDLDYNVLIDKTPIGKLSVDSGQITIQLEKHIPESIEVLRSSGVPESYLQVDGKPVEYNPIDLSSEKPTKDEGKKTGLCHVVNRDGTDMLMVGDMAIGVWNAETGKFDFTSTLGDPHPTILEEVRLMEAKRRLENLTSITAPLSIPVDDRTIEIGSPECEKDLVLPIVATMGDDIKLLEKVDDLTLKERYVEFAFKTGQTEVDENPEHTRRFWEIRNDPKWEGLFVENENHVEIVGFVSGKKSPIYELSNDHVISPGFIRTNLPSDETPNHNQVVISQSPAIALAFYERNRRDLIFNKHISIFAPTDKTQEKMAALSAAMLKPKEVLFVGGDEFIQRCLYFKKYFKGEVHTMTTEALSQNNLINKSTGADYNDALVNMAKQVPGWVVDAAKNRILFPVSSWDGQKFTVSGAGEITMKKETTNISVDAPGVYIHVGAGRIPEKLFVSANISQSFFEHIKADHATVLSPDLNSPQLTKICQHLGFTELEYLMDEQVAKENQCVPTLANQLITQPF